jgi:hypothetical protein
MMNTKLPCMTLVTQDTNSCERAAVDVQLEFARPPRTVLAFGFL